MNLSFSVVKSAPLSLRVRQLMPPGFLTDDAETKFRANAEPVETAAPPVVVQAQEVEPPAPAADAIARDLIAQAEQRAADLIATAQREAERLREAAQRRGWEEGVEAGRRESHDLIRALRRVAEEAIATRDQLLEQMTPEVMRLSLQIAEKIICREIATAPDVIVDMVRDAMRRVYDQQRLRVRLSPNDLPVAEEHRQELLNALEGLEQLELVADPSLQGGCLIETNNEVIDARLETQLQEIKRVVFGESTTEG